MSHLVGYLRADLRRYTDRTQRGALVIVLSVPGFQALVVYRICHYLHQFKRKNRLLSTLIAIINVFMCRLSEIITNVCIEPPAEIGPGLFIPHASGIVIGPVKMGSNCEVFQGVTLGQAGPYNTGVPTIGDRVYLGPGARVFGPIQLGDDVLVGANTVVTKSAPDRAVLMGVPAKLVSKQGSFDMVFYPGMDKDPDRQQSLASREVWEDIANTRYNALKNEATSQGGS